MFGIQGKRNSVRSFLKSKVYITFHLPVQNFQLTSSHPKIVYN